MIRGTGVLIHEPSVILHSDAVTLGDHVRIDAFAKLEGGDGLELRDRVHVASFAHLNIGGGRCWIGTEAAIASGGKVITGGNQLAAPSMSAAAVPGRQRVVRGHAVVGARAVVLVNAVVLPGVHLGEGAVLAAGGVASHDIPAWEVWGGVPARKLTDRPRFDSVCAACVLAGEPCPDCAPLACPLCPVGVAR
jgi:acetyltransferase-like isoleucine patch superfamily enzyme